MEIDQPQTPTVSEDDSDNSPINQLLQFLQSYYQLLECEPFTIVQFYCKDSIVLRNGQILRDDKATLKEYLLDEPKVVRVVESYQIQFIDEGDPPTYLVNLTGSYTTDSGGKATFIQSFIIQGEGEKDYIIKSDVYRSYVQNKVIQ
ncbi:hypothetical protein BLNAU_754 [Blattamonas nauphoetae]|uniref:NTF2 domain-containing protein n=1 Tax=Blattamonas nauphoetae TaxID=2049346 RepID=A0ABQ9YKF2_9EUKA|nr:hypothetical protein BLNAU_754 [Blattamonas nauphoetae]